MKCIVNGPPNHVIRPFENWTKKCLKRQMFGFQVFSIQMVNVVDKNFQYSVHEFLIL